MYAQYVRPVLGGRGLLNVVSANDARTNGISDDNCEMFSRFRRSFLGPI